MKRSLAIACVWMMAALVPVIASPRLLGQSRKDPLNDQEIEAVREAGDDPPARIKLFTGYVEQRVTEMHSLDTDRAAQNKSLRIHNLYDEFTRLADELQDNMDAFNEEHADLRKPLKEIVDKSAQWTAVLNEPPPSSQYDFVRKTALEANQSVHDAAVQMLADQTKYFIEKKKAEKAAEKAEQQR